MKFVPSHIFLTKGVGRHKEKLTSFELALRAAGIASFNLVSVSSIFPPKCKLISKSKGLSHRASPGSTRPSRSAKWVKRPSTARVAEVKTQAHRRAVFGR